MKVVHISTQDYGGAGLCTLRIHKALLNIGVDSKVLVAFKASDLPTVFVANESDINKYKPPKNKLLRKYKSLMRYKGKYLTRLEKYQRSVNQLRRETTYTFPISNYDLSNDPILADADVVHLHWVADFIDYPTFFSRINKPIVWTLHDENILYGGFHYRRDKDKYYSLCQYTEDELKKIKIDALAKTRCSIRLIAISELMRTLCNENPIVKMFPNKLIHNPIDSKSFIQMDKNVARHALGIPCDRIVLSFCSVSLSDERKGLKELIMALEKLNIDNITLICAGGGEIPVQTNLHIIRFGMIGNERLLSLFYSAADFFVMPSFQESFGQTPLEAMSCGTPVVAFPSGIISEVINEQNGVICDDYTSDSLLYGIKEALGRKYDRSQIRQSVISNFSPNIIANQYIDVYNEVIANNLSRTK